jgi:hypothetical protein
VHTVDSPRRPIGDTSPDATTLVLACQLLAVGRFVGRAAWTAAIALVIMFQLGPLDLLARAHGHPFGGNAFAHLWKCWTFPSGRTFFLALLYTMTTTYAVRFVFIDRHPGSQNPAVLQLGHIVFSNLDATVIAVG